MVTSDFDNLFKARFWSCVNVSATQDECWEWRGHVQTKGYGVIKFKQKAFRAHRVAYCLINDEVPDNLHVLHRCDNPKCCNPFHLFLGTQQTNNADMLKKMRHTYGCRAHGAKLTEDQVRSIRKLHQVGHPVYGSHPLARYFNVSAGTINSIVKRKKWKFLAD